MSPATTPVRRGAAVRFAVTALAAVVPAVLLGGCVRMAEPLREPPKFGTAHVSPPPPPPSPRGSGDIGFEEFVGSDTIYFDRDSAALTAEARKVLDLQAEWLATHPGVRVMLEGHSDQLGTREFAFALAERRAAAMRFYLVARGVAVERLQIVSFGKEQAAATSWDEQDQKPDRRGRTVLIHAASGVPAN